MLLEICRLKVAEVFAFLVVLGILGGDAYLVDVGIVITHLVVEHHQESAHLLIAVLLSHILDAQNLYLLTIYECLHLEIL